MRREFRIHSSRMMSASGEVSALFSISIYVESMLGLLLLFMWVQSFEIRAVGLVGQRAFVACRLDFAVRLVRAGA